MLTSLESLQLAFTWLDAVILVVNFAIMFSLRRSMKSLKASRNTLEQALAETNQMRAIAMNAMAKGPY